MKTEAQSDKMKVLLVEDDRDCLLMLATTLSLSNFDITPVSSAEQVLELLCDKEFDVLVTDINLPGIDGITLLRHVREHYIELPVVLITGYGSVDTAINALKLGAQDYLTKPLGDGHKLAVSINNAIQRHRLEIQNRNLQEQLRQSEATFRQLFHNATDAIYLFSIDSNGHPQIFEEVNDTACRQLKYSRKELLSLNILDITAEKHRISAETSIQSLAGTDTSILETVHLTKDGKRIPIELKAHLIVLRDKRLIMARARDISYHRHMEQQLATTVEQERQRLGRELHDLLCQDLASISMLTGVLGNKPDAVLINNLVKKSVSFVKGLCAGLFPVELDDEGLTSSIEQLISNNSIISIPCTYNTDGSIDTDDKDTALHIYRIVQESIINAAKHSKAKHISVGIKESDGNCLITVEDDGIGFSKTADTSSGMGLNIMKYRANIIGAILNIDTSETGGTKISCSWQQKN